MYEIVLSDDEDLPPLQKVPMPVSPHRIRLPSLTSDTGNLLRNLDDVERNKAKDESAILGNHGDAGAHGDFQYAANLKSEQRVAEDQRYSTFCVIINQEVIRTDT